MKQQSKLLIGLEALLFFVLAIAVFAWPGVTDIIIVYLAGAVLLVSGIVLLVQGMKLEVGKGLAIAQGIFSILFGLIMLFASPITGTLILVYTLLFWFIMTSIMQIMVASKVKGGWAVFSIVLSVIVILLSIWGFFDIVYAIGIYIWTISFGFMFMAISKFMQLFIPADAQTPEAK